MEYFEQLHSGIQIYQPDGCFRMSTDSVLAADFLTLHPNDIVADLGCGSGNISFLLLGKEPTCRLTGIELQQLACQAAQRTITQNHLQNQMQILQADLRKIRKLLPPCGFDAVISNPPYYPVQSGKMAANPLLSLARSEQNCSLQELCAAAAWLVKTGGYFTLVHKPERLCDLMCVLRQCGLEPKRLRWVRHHRDAEVSLVLLESKRGAKPGLKLEKDWILFHADGTPTDEYQAAYHMQQGD